jgi:hypothetical protein
MLMFGDKTDGKNTLYFVRRPWLRQVEQLDAEFRR